MKVILLEEVKGRGGEGDVIDVAHGFAVNYLLPRGIAIEATPGNLKQLEQRRHHIEKREMARVTDADRIFDALNDKTVTIEARVGEAGQLFGSVTSQMIEDAIKDQIGLEIDRKKIDTHGAIKEVGVAPVTVAIYREARATLLVNVVPEGGVVEDAPVEEEGVTVEEIVSGEFDEEAFDAEYGEESEEESADEVEESEDEAVSEDAE